MTGHVRPRGERAAGELLPGLVEHGVEAAGGYSHSACIGTA